MYSISDDFFLAQATTIKIFSNDARSHTHTHVLHRHTLGEKRVI
jgi:hypothetical protein